MITTVEDLVKKLNGLPPRFKIVSIFWDKRAYLNNEENEDIGYETFCNFITRYQHQCEISFTNSAINFSFSDEGTLKL